MLNCGARALTDVATGFSFTASVAVGPDKLLYVVELTAGIGAQGPQPGRVTRLLPSGAKEVVADGLTLPYGLAFDKAGNMYVSTEVTSLGPPPPAPTGKVLRFEGVARAPAMPGLPNTGAGGGGGHPGAAFAVGLLALGAAGVAARGRRRPRV